VKVEWLLEMNPTKRISLFYLIGNGIIFEMKIIIDQIVLYLAAER